MFDALMTLRPDIAALAQRPGALGQVFWVHAWEGDDGNRGHDPSDALATIQEAIDRCTNDHNDYILVTTCWEEAAMPIEINKTRIHILGIGGTSMCPTQTIHATNDTAIFIVTGESNECEIAGFSFGGGAAHGAIENIAGTPMGLYIHHCIFGHSFTGGDTPLHGIHIASNATAITIANCIFLGTGNDAGGVITGNGIYFNVSADTLGGLICNNLFVGIPGIGIEINSLGTGMIIIDNAFALDDNTAGAAITLSANVLGTLIANNVANFGKTTMGLIPWVDGATNTWMNNKRGGAATVAVDEPWVMPA